MGKTADGTKQTGTNRIGARAAAEDEYNSRKSEESSNWRLVKVRSSRLLTQKKGQSNESEDSSKRRGKEK